jgi:hypothetical protein
MRYPLADQQKPLLIFGRPAAFRRGPRNDFLVPFEPTPYHGDSVESPPAPARPRNGDKADRNLLRKDGRPE